VLLVDFKAGHSTSRLIGSMRASAPDGS